MSQIQKKTRKKRSRVIYLTLVFALVAILGCASVYAEQQEQAAELITKKCKVTASNANIDPSYLYDGKTNKTFVASGAGEQFITVSLQGSEAAGVYIKWGLNHYPWTLEATTADGMVVTSQQGQYGLYQEYAELPDNTVEFRIVTVDGNAAPLSLVELEVYSPGTLPSSVHVWEPTPSRAEIMFIATHQDDELLYFGGAIPYYSGELNYDSVVVYTAYQNDIRVHEALEGLWICGCTQNPVFFGYPDKRCMSLETARFYWNQDELTENIVRVMVSYQPQVVVTQDINGEYGHGQHLITVDSVRKALEKATDSEYVYSRLPGMEPWTVNKCYIHLYNKNKVRMPWGELKMTSAGGKSTLEVVREAYKKHVSQQKFGYKVTTDMTNYDCTSFGLYWTQVGYDEGRKDFFANITPRLTHVDPGDKVPDYLERIGSTGWFFRCVTDSWVDSQYLRYCSVNGEEGWYRTDYTGVLTEPAELILLTRDDYSIDLSEYETLTQISEWPRVFDYNDGVSNLTLSVRYCAVEKQSPAFYLSYEDGTLVQPLTVVQPTKKLPDKDQINPISPMVKPEQMDSTHTVIVIMSLLLVAVAIMLGVAVTALMNKKKRQRASRYNRRRYR